ncbi:MAG: hypothetical protein V4632_06495 [Pseudomonadota bacterium]
MQNDNSKVPDQPAEDKRDNRKTEDKGNLKQAVETGLPPGISPEQAKDPGKNAPDKGPADNRS